MERFTLELELGNDGMMTAGDVRQALENAGTRLVGLVGRETVLEELELVRVVDEWLLARGAPGELDALGPAETAARGIAGYWHGGQSTALYAFTSSGTILEELEGEVERELEEQREGLEWAEHRYSLELLGGSWEGPPEELVGFRENVRELVALLEYVRAGAES